jgi:hypothetical protein
MVEEAVRGMSSQAFSVRRPQILNIIATKYLHEDSRFLFHLNSKTIFRSMRREPCCGVTDASRSATDKTNTKLTMILAKTFMVLFLLPCLSQANKFDHDSASDCMERAKAGYCVKDDKTYAECPVTCADHHRPENPHWGGWEKGEPRPFYQFEFLEATGKTLHFSDFEGQVTIVALVPLLPGLADFHYKLLDHVLVVYQHTFVVSVVVLPMPGQDGIELQHHQHSQVKLLQGVGSEDHALVKYLSGKIQTGKFDPAQLNVFIVSPEGNHIEMHVSPDMAMYRKYIESQLKQIDEEL